MYRIGNTIVTVCLYNSEYITINELFELGTLQTELYEY